MPYGKKLSQPHMAVLRAGSGIDSNLTLIGVPFREILDDLTFDRFAIDVVRLTDEGPAATRHA